MRSWGSVPIRSIAGAPRIRSSAGSLRPSWTSSRGCTGSKGSEHCRCCARRCKLNSAGRRERPGLRLPNLMTERPLREVQLTLALTPDPAEAPEGSASCTVVSVSATTRNGEEDEGRTWTDLTRSANCCPLTRLSNFPRAKVGNIEKSVSHLARHQFLDHLGHSTSSLMSMVETARVAPSFIILVEHGSETTVPIASILIGYNQASPIFGVVQSFCRQPTHLLLLSQLNASRHQS